MNAPSSNLAHPNLAHPVIERALQHGFQSMSELVERVMDRYPERKSKRTRKERRTEPVGKTA